jgi:hypothetical protein
MSRGVLDKKVTRYLVGSVSNAPSVELCLKRSRSHLTPSSQSPSLPDDHCATTTLINGAVSTRVASRLRAGKMGVPAYSRSTPSTKRKAASFKLQSSELSSSQPHNTFPCGYLNTLSTSLCPHELHLKVTLIKLSIEMGKCLGETCADCLKSPMAELHMLGQSVCYNHGRSCLCNDTNASSLLPACFVPFSPQGARLSLNCQPPNIWNHFTVSLRTSVLWSQETCTRACPPWSLQDVSLAAAASGDNATHVGRVKSHASIAKCTREPGCSSTVHAQETGSS